MKTRSTHLALIYDNYDVWKKENFPVNLAIEHETFERELARLKLAGTSSILEVGFGEGHFLDWARKNGYAVQGIEISERYVAAAKARGHTVVHGSLEDVPLSPGEEYDAIVCIDVLEHMTDEQITEFFISARKLLKRGGAILIRVPNGGSPFGRYYQHGDATHCTALTGVKIDQLALPAGLRVTECFDAVRIPKPGRLGIRGRLKERFYGILVRVIERAVSFTYFGQETPMSPNLVVIVRRAEDSDRSIERSDILTSTVGGELSQP